MPYGIRGLHGEYAIVTDAGEWRLWTQPWYAPPQALEAHLEGAEFVVDDEGFVATVVFDNVRNNAPKKKLVSLEPDRWGRSWRSEIVLEIDRLLIEPDSHDLQDLTNQVLTPVCECVNRLLDALVYAGGPADLPPVSVHDFWAWTATFSHDGRPAGSVHVRGLQTFWWSGPRVLPEETQDRVRRTTSAKEGLALHEDLLVAARRKAALGDYRGSLVDAVCAVESVVVPAIKAELSRLGISTGKINSVIGPSGLGLASTVQVLLPLMSKGISPDSDIIEAFSQANGKRNKVVHEGQGVTQEEAQRHLGACSALVDMILKWRGSGGV